MTALAEALDAPGTLLLAATLAAYALAMTLGRGHFGPLNLALLLAAAFGVGLFVRAAARRQGYEEREVYAVERTAIADVGSK